MALIIPEATAKVRTPAGLYRFRLLSITDATYDAEGQPVRVTKDGNPQHRALWVFEVEAVVNGAEECEDFIGQEHWEWTTTSRNVNSNMRKWSEALLDRAISDNEPLSDAELVGKRSVATIGPVTNPQTGQISIKLAGMTPFRSKRTAGPAPAVVDAQTASGKRRAPVDDVLEGDGQAF